MMFKPLLLKGAKLGISVCAVLGFSVSLAYADYPNRSVEIIVPYSPGGSTDTTARLVAKGLSDVLGESFVVVNKPGAGGQIAHGQVANAKTDGYTLLFSAAGPLTVTPHSYSDLSYDALNSFEPVKLISEAPLALIASPKLGDVDLEAIIERAKNEPGALTYGSFGVGSAAHLAGELFKSLADVDMLHVPYKGSAPALVGLLGGETDLMFDVLVTALPHIKSGEVNPIAVTSEERTTLLPDVPTIAEAGVEGFEAQTWFGLLTPSGADPEIIEVLSNALDEVLVMPEFKKTIHSQGMEIGGGTPDDFDAFFRSEYEKWGKVANQAGIKLD